MKPYERGTGRISLLVPFHEDFGHRTRLWHWLRSYWRNELPDAEIVMGRDHSSFSGKLAFSKSVAVNDAFARSDGDVVVVLDADCYIPGEVVAHCAERIRAARRQGVPSWFIPYRAIYRLTAETTEDVLATDPTDPMRLPTPPLLSTVEDTAGSSWGHKYGAMIQIIPREGFEVVGCWDPRFRGWGGEDVSFLRAADTLYTQHKNVPGDVLHLWHPKFHAEPDGVTVDGAADAPPTKPWTTRMWAGQERPQSNDWLAILYNQATRHPREMRQLVDAGCHRDRDEGPMPALFAPVRWAWRLLRGHRP